MNFIKINLENAYVIEPSLLQDERGMFFRTFCKDEFKTIGLEKEFVQFNHSVNYKKGTLRGMHFQIGTASEAKLIRCIAGAVYDVIVDLRSNSSTYLNWFGTELSCDNKKMIFVPEGFAHGFQTLEHNSELLYHHTNFYSPAFERGIRFNDPLLGIHWPHKVTMISDKDKNYPILDCKEIFFLK